jgi:biotin transport system substrate-specific component
MTSADKFSQERSFEFSGQGIIAQALWVVLFAFATALGARVELQHTPVPYTLQTLVVLLSGAFLGSRNGALSQIVYLAVGVLGAPVFSGGSAGMAKIIGPTGGYLLAFPLAALVVGSLVRRHPGMLWAILSMTVGLAVIFLSGTAHLYAFFVHNWGEAFTSGFLIFTWWDILKLCAAAATYNELAKRWPTLPA